MSEMERVPIKTKFLWETSAEREPRGSASSVFAAGKNLEIGGLRLTI